MKGKFISKCFKVLAVSFVLVGICLSLVGCGGSGGNTNDYPPAREGESVSDYIKRADPELYNDMKDNYDSQTKR